MSLTAVNELKQDLEELEQLQKIAKRSQVQEFLRKEIDRLRREVLALERKMAPQPAAGAPGTEASNNVGGGDHVSSYVENITNYGFDQSDKFMQLYLTLDNLGDITDNNIVADFTKRSVMVKVQFPNKTSQLHIARLCEEIVAKDSYCKKKSKYVLVMLKKAEEGKRWQSLTEQEKKAKEKKRPKINENEDPGASLNNLLKNMYEEGDDEMKRTIAKAWYESQRKQNRDTDSLADL